MINYNDSLNIHSILPLSFANGPGRRMVIWLQGCSLGCTGCFNPGTHSTAPRHLMKINDIYDRICSNANAIEGITISGGEPFQQAEGLLKLLQRVRSETALSILVFSGYTMPQIRDLRPGEEILDTIDVLIAGPYIDQLRLTGNLRSSSNQKTHLLTARYNPSHMEEIPEAELQIDANGNVHITGFQDIIPANLKAIAGSGSSHGP